MPYSDNLYSTWDDDESDDELPVATTSLPVVQETTWFRSQTAASDTLSHAYRAHGSDARRGDRPVPVSVTGSHPLQDDSDEEVVREGAVQDHNGSGDGGDGDGDTEADMISPTDGYFRTASPSGWLPFPAPLPSTSTSAAAASSGAASSNVPYVPNVWVTDPSLEQWSTAESKAREAAEESRRTRADQVSPNTAEQRNIFPHRQAPRSDDHASTQVHHHDHTTSTSRSSVTRPTSPPASSSSYHYVPENYYRSSSSTGSSSRGAAHYTPSSSTYYPGTTASYRSYAPRRPPYQHSDIPAEAPPAYTPSPTSPNSSGSGSNSFASNYQTFSPTYTPAVYSAGGASIMGREEESQCLLANQPESMGGPADEYEDITPVWRERVRRRLPLFSWRTCKSIVIGLVLLLVTIGFLTSFITSVVKEREKQLGKHPDLKQPVTQDPVTKEPITTNPGNGNNGDSKRPHMDYPLIDNHDFSWGDHSCKDAEVQRSEHRYDVSFGAGHSFTFTQDVAKNYIDHGRDIHVSGEVIVRRAGNGTPGPSIIVEVTANDDRIIPVAQLDSSWDPNSQTMRISVPRMLSWDEANTRPCVNIRATLWVPEDGALNNFVVNNVHLSTWLMDNLSLKISEQTNLGSVVGKVFGAANGESGRTVEERLVRDGAPATFRLDSRQIEIKTTSGDIVGAWPLYDYLGLQTTSGDIRAGIDPKEASADVPKPAYLNIKSMSGDIEFNEPVDAALKAFAVIQANETLQAAGTGIQATAERILPPRDYRVDVQTTSGKIRGALAFSSQARFHSTSGDLTARLLPVFDKSLAEPVATKPADLETSGTSAKTDLAVLEPIWIDTTGLYVMLPPAAPKAPVAPDAGRDIVPIGKVGNEDPYNLVPAVSTRQPISSAAAALRCLYSRHTATSADIILRYPSSWEGTLAAGSTSGSIQLHGKDVVVTKAGEDWPGFNRRVEAYKGNDAESAGKLYVKVTSGKVDVLVGSD